MGAWTDGIACALARGWNAMTFDGPGQNAALAGYWVPRALAFEHRIAAGVTDPGVVDVSTTVLGHLPHMMIKLLDAGEREKFNRDMEWTLKISPEGAGSHCQPAASGIRGECIFDWLDEQVPA